MCAFCVSCMLNNPTITFFSFCCTEPVLLFVHTHPPKCPPWGTRLTRRWTMLTRSFWRPLARGLTRRWAMLTRSIWRRPTRGCGPTCPPVGSIWPFLCSCSAWRSTSSTLRNCKIIHFWGRVNLGGTFFDDVHSFERFWGESGWGESQFECFFLKVGRVTFFKKFWAVTEGHNLNYVDTILLHPCHSNP